MQKKALIEHTSLFINGINMAVTVMRSAARKRTITFKIDREKKLIIQAPMRTALKILKDLASKRSEWISEQVNKRQEEAHDKTAQLITGKQFPYLGQHYPLQISVTSNTRANCKLQDGVLAINIHHYANEVSRTHTITVALIKWYKRQAEMLVKERMLIWQQVLNVMPTGLKITNALRRWGSCNHKNSICINWRLIHAPLELIDYVIVHELCHIVHKNHSQDFWQLVASVLPDYKTRDKALDQQKMLFGST